ncbi:MAG: hypothetical protein K0Q67_725, partial [Cellvibrio sp.]|nr:hypothetical protein [Cellvibrio sp.]
MSKPPRHRRPLIEALEPRLLFSATADIAVFDDGASDGQYLAQAAEQVDLVSIYMPSESLAMNDQVSDVEPQADLPLNENPNITAVVFVDTAVDGYETLVEDIRARVDADSVAIVYLDPLKNGVDQITTALSQYAGLSALHIISHGSAGTLELGSSRLNANNIAQYEESLVAWRSALNGDADILLYGCDLAIDVAGQQLVEKIAAFTQADVAASDDFTGHQSLQGDWDLEFEVGDIASTGLISAEAQEAWVSVLATTHYVNIQ